MGFKDAVTTVLGKYATFTGRARRSEFWWFVLFHSLVSLAASAVDAVAFHVRDDVTGPAGWAVALALFLPSLAVTVRRLHDSGRSGWWILIAFIPIVGLITLVVFLVLDSEPGNAYGRSPKPVHPAEAAYLNG